MTLRQATMGGGCFWCTEAVMRELQGVHEVVSGYTGGRRPNPTYEQVCAGVTGHAEAVQVTYDDERIGYRELLVAFFATHDPTTPDRQGNDVGTQYRSAIFAHDEAQETEARAFIQELEREGVFPAPIVTQVERLGVWYPGEDYHQRYFERHPDQGYCAFVIAPKMAKFRKQFAERLRPA